MDVGIRELRAGLSRYVEQVKQGEEIVVTEHGKPVARLVPMNGERKFDRLIREGVLIPARSRAASSRRRSPVKGSSERNRAREAQLSAYFDSSSFVKLLLVSRGRRTPAWPGRRRRHAWPPLPCLPRVGAAIAVHIGAVAFPIVSMPTRS